MPGWSAERVADPVADQGHEMKVHRVAHRRGQRHGWPGPAPGGRGCGRRHDGRCRDDASRVRPRRGLSRWTYADLPADARTSPNNGQSSQHRSIRHPNRDRSKQPPLSQTALLTVVAAAATNCRVHDRGPGLGTWTRSALWISPRRPSGRRALPRAKPIIGTCYPSVKPACSRISRRQTLSARVTMTGPELGPMIDKRPYVEQRIHLPMRMRFRRAIVISILRLT